jgi:hypothetical protein
MIRRLILCAAWITLFTKPALSEWMPGGIPVCIDPEMQAHPHIVTDDAGGAIIIWRHWCMENGHGYLVHRAQRITPNRTLLWGDDGALVFPEMNLPTLCEVISDGEGGVICVFTVYSELNDYDIHAQRIDENGNALWSSDGVAVCTAPHSQTKPRCVSDGSGGAIIAWEDDRSYIEQTYVQRVSGEGACLWDEDGIHVSQDYDDALSPMVVEDGAGGAIIVWQDDRGWTDWDIYAQRIGADGTFYWEVGGVPICVESNRQTDPKIISTKAHGAIIMWEDWSDGVEYPSIYAQKVNPQGNIMLDYGGALICTMAHYYFDWNLISDGSDGAILTWSKITAPAEVNVFAQRMDSDGNILWGSDGVAVGGMTGDEVNPAIVAGGNGGAIIVWRDSSMLDWELYAQRVDENGNTLWATSGISLCCEAQFGGSEPAIASNGDGGIIAAWHDVRHIYVSDHDIYAQIIDADGAINITSDSPPTACRLYSNYPNPFNPTTTIRFHLSERSDVRLDIYDVTGAHVTRLASGFYEEGMHAIPWNGRAVDGRAVNSGVYFCRLTTGANMLSSKMVLLR